MSIPFFFRPFPWGNKFFVDGGTISNFPAWIFDQDVLDDGDAALPFPVLGFRLSPETQPVQTVSNFKEYEFGGVVKHGARGHGPFQTRKIAGLRLINIPIPPRLDATKFNLSAAESEELYFKVRNAGLRVFQGSRKSFVPEPSVG